MRMLQGAVLAAALLAPAPAAYAAEATGKIKSLDMTKDMVTLGSGLIDQSQKATAAAMQIADK